MRRGDDGGAAAGTPAGRANSFLEKSRGVICVTVRIAARA
jgi:hypothetical protein